MPISRADPSAPELVEDSHGVEAEAASGFLKREALDVEADHLLHLVRLRRIAAQGYACPIENYTRGDSMDAVLARDFIGDPTCAVAFKDLFFDISMELLPQTCGTWRLARPLQCHASDLATGFCY
ncbi:hypothetical protein GCM10027027_14140 [Neomicrococcus lactis]